MSRRRWLWLALSILWAGFIFWNSAQNAATSDAMSDGVIELLGLELSAFWVRKTAHFCAFALLGILLQRFFANGAKPVPYGTLLLLCLAVACADETVQLFPVGRSSELRDVWIDFAGALTGVAGITALRRLFGRKA